MIVRFEGHRLDLGSRQLFRGDAEVHLSPKAFDLLRFLIEQRTRAVSKSELHDRLWPGTFVTEANLAWLVSELRRALQDHSGSPRFIRTVPRFGYAFCAPIVDAAGGFERNHLCWVVYNGREFPLMEGENVIGRDADAAVRLESPSVSRRHARIVVSDEIVTLEDLGSKNGTLWGQAKIADRVRLNDLDEIQVGAIRMLVRIMRGGETTETTER